MIFDVIKEKAKDTLKTIIGLDVEETSKLKTELAKIKARSNIQLYVPDVFLEDKKYDDKESNYPYPLSFQLYEVDGRYEYEILENEIPVLHQDFEPGVEGFIKMTKETAEARAREHLQWRIDTYVNEAANGSN